MADVIPVGAIVAFAGPLTTVDEGKWLESQGWMLCDGRTLTKKDYIDLFLSIEGNFGGSGGLSGTFNLPDLRGRFPRGVSLGSGADPNATTRTESAAGGQDGDLAGSLQMGATALPANPFVTANDGEHSHAAQHAPIGNNAYPIAGSRYGLWNSGSVTTNSAGAHTHTITTGFDKESRPPNRYVNFIIKFAEGGSQ
ncbi:MAG: phage tail protein [Actinomycetota bacterium]|nr:phage tail protein [Actinomycetota bacterium]